MHEEHVAQRCLHGHGGGGGRYVSLPVRSITFQRGSDAHLASWIRRLLHALRVGAGRRIRSPAWAPPPCPRSQAWLGEAGPASVPRHGVEQRARSGPRIGNEPRRARHAAGVAGRRGPVGRAGGRAAAPCGLAPRRRGARGARRARARARAATAAGARERRRCGGAARRQCRAQPRARRRCADRRPRAARGRAPDRALRCPGWGGAERGASAVLATPSCWTAGLAAGAVSDWLITAGGCQARVSLQTRRMLKTPLCAMHALKRLQALHMTRVGERASDTS